MREVKYAGLGLVIIGLVVILFAVNLSYNEYKASSDIHIPSNIQSSLTSVLSVFTVIAVKAIFISIMVWGGGVILGNGIKSLKIETPKETEKKGEGE